MRTLLGAAVTSAALAAASLGATGTAGADSGSAYSLQAQGIGLKVSVGGTSLVAGTSSATAGLSAPAQAQGSGTLTPAVSASQQATASAPGTSQNLPQTCAQPTVPFPAPFSSLLSLGAGCASASAAEDAAGLPTATATGQVASISVTPSASALPVPVNPGSTLASTLQGVLGTLPQLPTGGLPLSSVLDAVAAAANANLTALLTATLGTSTSSVQRDGHLGARQHQEHRRKDQPPERARCRRGAAPRDHRGPGGHHHLDRPLHRQRHGDRLPGDGERHLELARRGSPDRVGRAGCLPDVPERHPLQTTIAVGSGTANPGANKGSATATGLTVDALEGVGASSPTATDGGVDVEISSSSSGATAAAPAAPAVAAAAVTPPTAAPPPAPVAAAPATVPGVTTVHTGLPWAGTLPLVLVALAMVTGLGLLTRRHVLAAAHRLTDVVRPSPSAGGPPPGPASGTSSVPPPVPGPARRQSS